MRRTILVLCQVVLLILLCVPAAWADGSISMSLDRTEAGPGDAVSASGITAPDAWVPIKILDENKNIILFDTGKAGSDGRYKIDFQVPENAPGILTVVVGEGKDVKTAVLNGPADEKPIASGGGGGGGGAAAAKPVTSDTGKAAVSPAAGGTVSLGEAVFINIPANTLEGNNPVEVKVKEVTAANETPSGFRILGQVYEFSIGDLQSYSFAGNVTISFSFDPGLLESGEIPAIYYYDADQAEWISLGGTLSGNTISVEVDHFTRFAVLVQEKTPGAPPASLKDVAGHWAENNIRKLVGLKAVSGYPDGAFKPDNKITRAEFTVILVKAFNLEAQGNKVFADTQNHWAGGPISIAASSGIVNGYDENTFGPDDSITREQMAVITVNAARLNTQAAELTFADSRDISGWAKESLAIAVQNGIITGYPDKTVRPQGYATRAEAVTVIINADQEIKVDGMVE